MLMQAYLARDAMDLFNTDFVKDLPITDWLEVSSAPPVNRTLAPLRPYIKCCGLKEGANMIEFDKDCAWDNFLAPNYTSPFMPFYIANSSNHNASIFNATVALFTKGLRPSLRLMPNP